MYAVLVTGGKQYRVMQGETLRVELLDVEAGKQVTFDNVLMLGDGEGVTLGDALKGASVTATRGSADAASRRSPRRTATRPLAGRSTRPSNSSPRPLKTRTVSPASSRSTRVRCCASSSGRGTTSPGAPASGA